jgi:dTDP-4-amino-4,6-dideoxygalactose transaminase
MIPFNKPYLTGKELEYIQQAHTNGQLAGDGPFTQKCHAWLENTIGCSKALLTHSCTGALEMVALLANLQPGDEVIMPSFTFVSTANAFVLRGAVPVFVDIRPDTLNMDETKIEAALTPQTRAIVPVHYAGVGCEMDPILDIAQKHALWVFEDAAQGICSNYKDEPLGSFGNLAALSFHETKNIISGEGGALLINQAKFVERAEIIREKGTNRSRFFRGQVDKYTWVDLGSSFLPGEIVAAFLYAQMEQAWEITSRRLKLWETYHQAFADLELKGLVRRPFIPAHCGHNAHMYYLLVNNADQRNVLLDRLNKTEGINAVFHYLPLHLSPAGMKHGRTSGFLSNTENTSGRLLRLPMWIGVEDKQAEVIERVKKAIQSA